MRSTTNRMPSVYSAQLGRIAILATSVILQIAGGSFAKPASGIPDVLSGRVLSAEEEPIAGATVYVTSDPRLQKTTDRNGEFRFSEADTERLLLKAEADKPRGGVDVVAVADGFGLDWIELRRRGTPSEGDLQAEAARNIKLRLVKDDVPIRGRLVNHEGRPIPDVSVGLGQVLVLPEDDLSAWLKDWETSRHKPWQMLASQAHKRYKPLRRVFPYRDAADVSEPAFPATVTTDQEGRFEIRGVGRERAVWLSLKHPDFLYKIFFSATRDHFELKPAQPTLPPLHPATFVQALDPAKPIRGTVREHGTGRPVAGATVYAQMYPHRNTEVAKAVTTAGGSFDIVGLGEAEGYRLVVVPAEGQPHLRRILRPAATTGLEPLNVDVELFRGVVVQGRVTDKVTGQPIYHAILSYILLPGNPHSQEIAEAGDEAWDDRFETDHEGTFAVTVPPGPGLIGVRNRYGGQGQYCQLKKEGFPYPPEKAETLRTSFRGAVRPEQYHAVVKVNPPEDGGTERLNVQLNPVEGK